jgi:cyclic beta-1,2-glucan synthetase
MLDNLRRSVSPPSVVLALVAGWTMPLDGAAIWTAFILGTIVLPPLIPAIANNAPLRPGATLNSHLRALRAELTLGLVQSSLMIVFLADQAWMMGDAIVRTLFRLTVTRRHLLEWVPSAQVESTARPDILSSYQRMTGALVVAAATTAVT